MSSSITNSNLYNVSSSNNGLSGLMSGMDTESMVKKMLSGTQGKIDKQNQLKTTTEWKQTIYQGVVSDINTFKSKYFDSTYGSTLTTNLASSSFFNSMVSSVTSGSSVKVVSSSSGAATGDMSVIVSQLAEAAKITSQGKMSDTQTITGNTMDVTSIQSAIASGKELAITLSLDGTAKTLTFSKDDFSGTIDASTIKSALDAELSKAFGSYVKATMPADNKLTFSLNLKDTNGNPEDGHELTVTGSDANSFGITPGASTLISGATKLSDLTGIQGSTYSFTINGTAFSFSSTDTVSSMMNKINVSSAGVKLSYSSMADKFTMQTASTGAQYGIDMSQQSGNILSVLFGSSAVSAASKASSETLQTSSSGGSSAVTGDTNIADILQLQGLSFLKADGVTPATTLSDVASFSGVGNAISFSDGKLYISGTSNLDLTGTGLESLFGAAVALGTGTSAAGAVSSGTDALVSVNGVSTSRSSNTFTVNGITLTATKANASETNVIGTTRDTDSVVSAIKSFVTDYNTMATKFYSLITEDPDYRDYAPLTSAQKEDMKDTEITAWEKKAKTGLVRSDTDISSFLSSMRSAMDQTCEKAGIALYSIGVETSAWDLTGKLSIDESALKSALASHPESVATLFTDSTSGLAKQLSTICDKTAKLSVSTPGSLVQLAGASGWSVNAKTNEMYKTLSSISDKLDDLQDKYDDEKERYWAKFSAMETAMASYSSQSSMLTSSFSS